MKGSKQNTYAPANGKRLRSVPSDKVGGALLFILAILYLIPILLTLVKSLKYGETSLTLRQYFDLLTTNYTVMRYFWNSVFYALIITVSGLLVSIPLGFLFAKVKFRGREALFFLYLLVTLLPFQATLLPNYIVLRDMGLLETRFALLLPMIFSPFAVFLLRQFMLCIEDEQIEYTLLETSSVLRLLIHVVLPQIKEGLIALAVLLFCESWNMVEQVVIFTSNNPDIWPLSVMLESVPEDVRFAGAVVYLYPVLVLFLCFRGLVTNAVEKFKW